MCRKYVLGKITVFGGIIIGEIIEKKVTFKKSDVFKLPIFHKLEPTQKNKCHILFREGLFY